MSIENLQGQNSRCRQVLERVEHSVQPILIGIRESYSEPIHATRQLMATGNSRLTAITMITGYFTILSPGTWLTLLGIVEGNLVTAASGIAMFGVHGWICRNMRENTRVRR